MFVSVILFSQDLSYSGVDRAVGGDLEGAFKKFDQCLDILPYHREATLYKSIIEDVKKDNLDESYAKSIFYALRDLKGSKENRVEDFTRLIKKNPSYIPLYILRAKEQPDKNNTLQDLNTAQ